MTIAFTSKSGVLDGFSNGDLSKAKKLKELGFGKDRFAGYANKYSHKYGEKYKKLLNIDQFLGGLTKDHCRIELGQLDQQLVAYLQNQEKVGVKFHCEIVVENSNIGRVVFGIEDNKKIYFKKK